MSISIEFLTGPHDELLEALTNDDYDKMEPLVEKRADFSLHLEEDDLQILFDKAEQYTKLPIPLFEDARTSYCDEDEEYGYYIMHENWVQTIATMEPDIAKTLAKEWYTEMAEFYQYPDTITNVQEAETAIHDFIELCKFVTEQGKPLMYVWML